MSYTLEEAVKQADMLLKASSGSPCRQIRYELYKRGKEWQHVVEEMDGDDPDDPTAVIELISSVGPGMMVPGGGRGGDGGWWPVVRVMHRDGQSSLHLEDPDGRAVYRNFFGPSSPIVVKA